jgi:hypothetical protein
VTDNAETAQKTKQDPAKFDWVTERSSCSLPKVFLTLRQQVEADVKTRNSLRPANSPYEFSVSDEGTGFAAILQSGDAGRSVKFTLADHAIQVTDDNGDQMFEITLTFNDQGECKWNINKAEHEPWQIRRMALDDPMFRGY